MATDMMVWNITKDGITERMAVAPEDAWPVPGDAVQPPPDKGRPSPLSDAMNAGRWDTYDVEKQMLDAWSEEHGLQDQDWRKQN